MQIEQLILITGLHVLKLGLMTFTNLVGCATLFQGDTCPPQKDAKYTFISLFRNSFLLLPTSTATLLCFCVEKRIKPSHKKTLSSGNQLHGFTCSILVSQGVNVS